MCRAYQLWYIALDAETVGRWWRKKHRSLAACSAPATQESQQPCCSAEHTALRTVGDCHTMKDLLPKPLLNSTNSLRIRRVLALVHVIPTHLGSEGPALNWNIKLWSKPSSGWPLPSNLSHLTARGSSSALGGNGADTPPTLELARGKGHHRISVRSGSHTSHMNEL